MTKHSGSGQGLGDYVQQGIRWVLDQWHRRHRFYANSLVVTVGIILVAGVALFGASKYAENPSFCNSCHIMEPYYEAWRTSKHNFVKCVDCHYPPGTLKTKLWMKFQALSQVAKYVTRTYSSKPYAEIEDSSCLRSGCHSERLLDGRVVSEMGIKFDHRPHLLTPKKGRQLRCVSCHSQIVVGNHVEVTYDTCYLCHFRDRGEGKTLDPIGGCLGCHELPPKPIQVGNMSYDHQAFVGKRGVACVNCHIDVVRGSGMAKKERCYTCHNQPEHLAKFDDIPFLHENHVTNHNVACVHCHEPIRHGSGEASQQVIGSIGAAPTVSMPSPELHKMPTLAFECNFCHENKHAGQLEMYGGRVSALDLPEIPSPMYLANVDCVGCHYEEAGEHKAHEFQGETIPASPQACVKCHGDAFLGIWDDTRTELTATLTPIAEKLKAVRAEAKVSATPTEEELWIRDAMAKADRWYNFVRLAKGDHNIYLASVTLRKADTLLGEVATKLGLKVKDLSGLPLMSGRYCATMCHGKVGVAVPATTVETRGRTMPHLKHTEMMACVDCHVIGGHKDATLRPDAEALCAGCHDFSTPAE